MTATGNFAYQTADKIILNKVLCIDCINGIFEVLTKPLLLKFCVMDIILSVYVEENLLNRKSFTANFNGQTDKGSQEDRYALKSNFSAQMSILGIHRSR